MNKKIRTNWLSKVFTTQVNGQIFGRLYFVILVNVSWFIFLVLEYGIGAGGDMGTRGLGTGAGGGQ